MKNLTAAGLVALMVLPTIAFAQNTGPIEEVLVRAPAVGAAYAVTEIGTHEPTYYFGDELQQGVSREIQGALDHVLEETLGKDNSEQGAENPFYISAY